MAVVRGLADTSVFIGLESRRPLNVELLPDQLAVSVITIGELRAGVLATHEVTVRDLRLRTLTRALELSPIQINAEVADAWATLRVLLRDRGLRMPVNDSWIAATALALGVPVVTQNDDYTQLPVSTSSESEPTARVLRQRAGETLRANRRAPDRGTRRDGLR